MIVVYAKLVEFFRDVGDYITYVFQVLDENNIKEIGTYCMCVQYPNWEQEPISIGDIGYLKIKYVQGGIDQWFDGKEMKYYRYDNIVFMKFIKEKHKTVSITF